MSHSTLKCFAAIGFAAASAISFFHNHALLGVIYGTTSALFCLGLWVDHRRARLTQRK